MPNKILDALKNVGIDPSTTAELWEMQKSGGPGVVNNATTNPWTGKINMNSPRLEAMPQPKVEQIFAHELQHRKDFGDKGWGDMAMHSLRGILGQQEPYGQREEELAGFQAGNDYAVQHNQPVMMDMPNFSSPGFRSQGDIELPGKQAPKAPIAPYFSPRPMR